MVEELFPAVIAFAAEVNVDKRISFRLEWFFNQRHTRLLGCFAAFFHITFGTGADDIFPG